MLATLAREQAMAERKQLQVKRTPQERQTKSLVLSVSDSLLNQRLLQRIAWGKELSEEIKYWRMWFATGGDEWPDDYKQRLDPSREFDPRLRQFIDLPEDKEIKVLDVGSGPVTGVGFVWPGRKLKVVAVDPLADVYNKLLAEFALAAPVRTEKCPAERLAARFRRQRFDLVHCRNALDHSYDPLAAIRQMLMVTAPHAAVVLDHYANEALHHSYRGLHRWNFDIQNGRLFLWNRESKIDVGDALGNQIDLECNARSQERIWVMAVLRAKSQGRS
jgi:SAM-dependent methyltransferase